MATKIFVNLCVNDLNKSKDFFTSLGYTFNPQFTNEQAGCLVISEDIYAMLVTKEYFKTFTKKEVADPAKSTEVLLALSMDSKEKVDQISSKAVAAGGKVARDPSDIGWMYSKSFEDPDGHIWEVFWMDMSKAP